MTNSKLAIGTVQFGLPYGVSNSTGQVTQNDASSILTHAKAQGIQTLDTAIAYGNSEEVLGRIGVQGWDVISKLPAVPIEVENTTEWVYSQVCASLDRLNISKLDALLLHRPEQLQTGQGQDLYAALQLLKAQGLVRKIGISVYGVDELERFAQQWLWDVVQAPLNILDRSLESSGWARRLHHEGIELHVRSVFLQGLLLMDKQSRPAKFARWSSLWDQWDEWLGDNQISALQACLQYVVSIPEVARVVIGIESVQQLSDIVDAAKSTVMLPPQWNSPVETELINPAKWGQL